jgi:hypothetical protein
MNVQGMAASGGQIAKRRTRRIEVFRVRPIARDLNLTAIDRRPEVIALLKNSTSALSPGRNQLSGAVSYLLKEFA